MEKILVRGQFLGYRAAKVLELNGYEITFFNIGENTPKLFSNFYKKVGDRHEHKNEIFLADLVLI